jgi:hypothetical protein
MSPKNKKPTRATAGPDYPKLGETMKKGWVKISCNDDVCYAAYGAVSPEGFFLVMTGRYGNPRPGQPVWVATYESWNLFCGGDGPRGVDLVDTMEKALESCTVIENPKLEGDAHQ